jgi:DNA invertase Pin-like site-specific DNA recombinase
MSASIVNSGRYKRSAKSVRPISRASSKGWSELSKTYEDSGQSGGSLERPALQDLIADIESGVVDLVVIYKIDRLTRSLTDFVRLVDMFDRYSVAFVSITQSFDTSDSMGRLILNILLTFAQFEREMIADRIRDSIAARKRRGKWTGGVPPYGYDVIDGKLVINEPEADTVRHIFRRFLELGSYTALRKEVFASGMRTKIRTNRQSKLIGGTPASSGMIYNMLACRFYVGEVPHFDEEYPGEQEPILDRDLWDRAQALRAQRSMYKLHLGLSPNILLGFIVDGYGRPMTIADDSTKGTRYRYYISIQERWAIRKGIKRVRAEAGQLEHLVISALKSFLCERQETRSALFRLGRGNGILDRLGVLGPVTARRLETVSIEQLRLISTALFYRVEVASEHVDIAIRLPELERLLLWDGRGIFRIDKSFDGHERLQPLIRLPVAAARFQRAIVMPVERASQADQYAPSKSLVALIREARRAQAAVEVNRSQSLAEIAVTFQREPGLFARILRLNYLAPDIVTAILDGRQPLDLTRKNLVNANLPMDWSLQRKLLGFAERPDVQRRVDGQRKSAHSENESSTGSKLGGGLRNRSASWRDEFALD